MERQAESAQLSENVPLTGEDFRVQHAGATKEEADACLDKDDEGESLIGNKLVSGSLRKIVSDGEVPAVPETKTHKVQLWTQIRPSLHAIENEMSNRAKKKSNLSKNKSDSRPGKPLLPFEEARSPKGASEEDSDDEFYDVERSDLAQDAPSSDVSCASAETNGGDLSPPESLLPSKEELECLIRGGVPMALRGEVYHAWLSFCLSMPLEYQFSKFKLLLCCFFTTTALASLCGRKGTSCRKLLSRSAFSRKYVWC